ncbi:MAG: tetratricopeptide repeat protein [Planctomycetota bacterium]
MRVLLLLALALAACSAESSTPIPRFGADGAVEPDPLLEEALDAAYAEAERGTSGALLELAKTYEANTLGELAADTYRLCLARGGPELGEDPVRLQHHIGCSLEETLRADEALAAFEEVRQRAPDYAPGHWRAGNLLADQGRDAEARAAFERALELEPGGVPQTLGLARVELAEGEAPAARARLEELARRMPRERFVHGLLARARRATGDEAGANAALRMEERAGETSWIDPWAAEVRRRTTGVSPTVKKANELLLAGDARGALALLEPLQARVPESLPVVQLLIKACLEAGALAKAETQLGAARARFGAQFKLELYAGLLALQRGELESAKRALDASLAINPAYGQTLAAMGEVELKRGNLAAAEHAFARAIEQEVLDLRTRILFAQVRIQLGKFDDALEVLRKLRADFPDSVVPLAHKAEALARAGRIEEARATLAEAERLDPSFGYLAKVRALLEGR